MKSKIPIKKKCEWCGKDFIAYKVTTRFCSKQCNSYAYKDMLRNQRIKLVQYSIIVQEQNETDSKEYLSPKETAMLLSVDRVTIYRYLWDGLLPCIRMRGKTFIRKADIEKMFDEAKPYQKRHKNERALITEFYTTAEILDKYGISESGLYKIAKSENIPKMFQRGKSYWSKKHIDAYFAKKAVDAKHHGMVFCGRHKREVQHDYYCRLYFCFKFQDTQEANKEGSALLQAPCGYCQRHCRT